MRRSSYLLVTVFALALGACAGLLPDVEGLSDVYGLDGAVIVLRGPDAGVAERTGETASAGEARRTSAAGRASDAGATTLVGALAASFSTEGIDLPSAAARLARAASVRDTLTIDPNVTVRVPGDAVDAPARFAIDGASLELAFRHDGATVGDVGGAASFMPAVVVTKVACDEERDEPTTCAYDAAVSDEARIVIAASRAAALFDALVAGGTFAVEGAAQVTLEAPGVPAGTEVLVTLRAVPEAGVISFR